MKLTIVEGTPDEIRQAFPGLADIGGVIIPQKQTADAGAHEEQSGSEPLGKFVSRAVARDVLRRRALSAEQRKILSILYKAHPKRVLGTTLQERLGYRRPQFTGLMGAFGNRLTHTEGYVPNTAFFDQEWDYEHNSFSYTLPKSVREALETEGLV